MQVTETLSEGLKREFKVVVPAAELDTKVNARLNELKDRVRIDGFRPGKVPVAHLKRLYGKSAMAEVIEAAVRDANSQIVTERGLKLAGEPKVDFPSDQAEVENLMEGKSDLAYTVALEILPAITLADFKTIKLEKPVAEVADSEVDEALQTIATQNRPYAAKDGKSEKDDRVVIDFVGSIDGKPFEGGTGEGISVQIGSNTFIPGFEDQLIGVAAGDKKEVKATFPANYMNAELAGKDASFDVTVKSVEAPQSVTIDEEFAKSLGLESLDKLRTAVKERIEAEHGGMTRQKVKRALLDALDKLHKFDPPPSLVEDEFNRVWQSVNTELQQQNKTFADENTTEEKAREDYGKIAERRVRLGLVLAEIGDKNKIEVSEDELNRALVEQARRFPGQEKQVWDYYRNNPGAIAGLRAPLYEEKVVDFLMELADVSEKKVSREDLYKDDAPAA
ncbi:MAG: trigger factor [Xanthobacteraceae bacterium]|uniref:trigger factor n=1 Tax=Pseudolabrys sp. TaxID=1960880 RepID=UPI003D10CCAE